MLPPTIPLHNPISIPLVLASYPWSSAYTSFSCISKKPSYSFGNLGISLLGHAGELIDIIVS